MSQHLQEFDDDSSKGTRRSKFSDIKHVLLKLQHIFVFQKWYEEFLDLFKGMADFSMFSELHFMLMSISTTFLFTWFVVPYFYLAEHLVREEYTESEASLVLSVIGITNTIGMVSNFYICSITLTRKLVSF